MVNSKEHLELKGVMNDFFDDVFDLCYEYDYYAEDFSARDWTEEFENVYGFYPDEDDVRLHSYIEDFKNTWSI